MDRNNLIGIINDECFWEYQFSNDQLDEMIQGNDFRKKSFIFGKILENSTHVLQLMSIFPKEDLLKLMDNYQIPGFNKSLVQRRLSIMQFHFARKQIHIPELAWKTG